MAEIKERLIEDSEQIKQQIEKPIEGMVDLEKNREAFVPREVKSWMEKVEEDPSLNNNQSQIKGDDDSILQPIAPAVVRIQLPSNKSNFSKGFSKTVNDAGRWLSEFVFRLIKKNKGNVKFKEE